jgi:hypothetical protein
MNRVIFTEACSPCEKDKKVEWLWALQLLQKCTYETWLRVSACGGVYGRPSAPPGVVADVESPGILQRSVMC